MAAQAQGGVYIHGESGSGMARGFHVILTACGDSVDDLYIDISGCL